LTHTFPHSVPKKPENREYGDLFSGEGVPQVKDVPLPFTFSVVKPHLPLKPPPGPYNRGNPPGKANTRIASFSVIQMLLFVTSWYPT
jgi:hypothetical protein